MLFFFNNTKLHGKDGKKNLFVKQPSITSIGKNKTDQLVGLNDLSIAIEKERNRIESVGK